MNGVQRLRVLYRTHPGANRKPRPDWYDRATCLASLRVALAQCSATCGVEVELLFLADGGMPADLHDEPERVVALNGGSARRSFRAAVTIARGLARDDAPGTLYWLAEDDYLYQPHSMTQLVQAARRWPTNHYFTLYTPDDSAWSALHASQPHRPVPALEQAAVLDGQPWHRITSSTSTLGVMRDDLLQDAAALRFLSLTGAPFDGPTELALQGIPPYDLRHALGDLQAGLGVRTVAKAVGVPTMRVLVNTAALLRRRRRVVVAPVQDLAVHAELGYLSTTHDWSALADAVRRR